ncbi:MIP/aquaporin family protein [Rhodohalobacter halophilus]|uniref:MIP/aquaporin family protein n=1 Tax=Rhodohalobacter halophilus TaxID=1812810 RepID=UPI00083F93BA|nr:aquaporin [Rhodohalobacter halophilus]
MLKYSIEFFGTFLLVTALGISGNLLAIGLLLAALVYIGADHSGAHFNPAVTLASWASDEIPTSKLFPYFTFQITGAIAAAGFIWWLNGSTFLTEPASGTGLLQFAAVEFFFSFIFVLTFLKFIYPNKNRKNPVYGLMVGGTLGACYLFSEIYSGIGLNPALSIGYASADFLNNGSFYINLPFYLFSPLIGGLTASYVHRLLSARSR